MKLDWSSMYKEAIEIRERNKEKVESFKIDKVHAVRVVSMENNRYWFLFCENGQSVRFVSMSRESLSKCFEAFKKCYPATTNADLIKSETILLETPYKPHLPDENSRRPARPGFLSEPIDTFLKRKMIFPG